MRASNCSSMALDHAGGVHFNIQQRKIIIIYIMYIAITILDGIGRPEVNQ